AFLPPLFAALLILLAGWLLANFLSRTILIAAVNARLPEARLLARAAHWAIVLFTVATALTHLGIGKEMVLVAFGITFGGLVFALALAFGLGGRHLAAQLLARRLRRESPPPPRARPAAGASHPPRKTSTRPAWGRRGRTRRRPWRATRVRIRLRGSAGAPTRPSALPGRSPAHRRHRCR